MDLNDKDTWALKPEFEYLRHATLKWAQCPKCKRGSAWSKLPVKCNNPGCTGTIKG